MRNYFELDEPGAISFSGGRTSAYMLWLFLDCYDGLLPDHLKVIFANTGKEMLETLDFVNECSKQWNVDITWLECDARKGGESEKKFVYDTKIVSYETASRNGEPFEKLIKARNYLPNPVARFCTQELKVLRIRDHMHTLYPKIKNHVQWSNIVGIRYDEPRRAIARRKVGDLIPLYDAKITKKEVCDFWNRQSFDLQLENDNGVAHLGNCDLCFLKGVTKKASIVRDDKSKADWWIKQEKQTNAFFRNDQPSYTQLLNFADDQINIFESEDVSCYCGD